MVRPELGDSFEAIETFAHSIVAGDAPANSLDRLMLSGGKQAADTGGVQTTRDCEH